MVCTGRRRCGDATLRRRWRASLRVRAVSDSIHISLLSPGHSSVGALAASRGGRLQAKLRQAPVAAAAIGVTAAARSDISLTLR